MCVLSYVNGMEVSCSSFMSHVWSFSHCLDWLRLLSCARVVGIILYIAQAKLLYLVHA